MKKKINPSQGKVLIANPSLIDSFFKKSVVLLTEHDENGTIGLIINKLTNLKLSELSNDFIDFNFPLYFGGPVSYNNLFFLHEIEGIIPDSVKIMDGLFWGGDFEMVKNLIRKKVLTTNNIRFFIGYSGWEPKQLDRELEDDSWIVSSTNIDKIINTNPSNLWENIMKSFGQEYAIWTNFPSDPLMN